MYLCPVASNLLSRPQTETPERSQTTAGHPRWWGGPDVDHHPYHSVVDCDMYMTRTLQEPLIFISTPAKE